MALALFPSKQQVGSYSVRLRIFWLKQWNYIFDHCLSATSFFATQYALVSSLSDALENDAKVPKNTKVKALSDKFMMCLFAVMKVFNVEITGLLLFTGSTEF